MVVLGILIKLKLARVMNASWDCYSVRILAGRSHYFPQESLLHPPPVQIFNMTEVLPPATSPYLQTPEPPLQSLDDLLERYLNLLDSYQKLQTKLTNHLSSVNSPPRPFLPLPLPLPSPTAQGLPSSLPCIGLHISRASQLHLPTPHPPWPRLLRPENASHAENVILTSYQPV